MRHLAMLSLLSLPLWLACGGVQSSPSSSPYRIESENVEGARRATLRDLRAMRPEGGTVVFDLVAWEGDPDVSVRTTTVSSDWQFRDCQRLRFVADGRSVPVRNLEHEGERVDGQVVEHLSGEVLDWNFRAVARADRAVRAELCQEVVRFEQPERQAMTALARVAWSGLEPATPGGLGPERRWLDDSPF